MQAHYFDIFADKDLVLKVEHIKALFLGKLLTCFENIWFLTNGLTCSAKGKVLEERTMKR